MILTVPWYHTPVVLQSSQFSQKILLKYTNPQIKGIETHVSPGPDVGEEPEVQRGKLASSGHLLLLGLEFLPVCEFCILCTMPGCLGLLAPSGVKHLASA